MTEQTGVKAENKIIEDILAEARTQAKQIMDNAQSVADIEEQKTLRLIEDARMELLNKAEARISRLHAQQHASAEIEAKRELLAAREEGVSHILAKAREHLSSMRSDRSSYRNLLKALATQAVKGIGRERVVLQISRQDQVVADASFMEEVASDAAKEMGVPALNVTLEPVEKDLGGGCIALSEERHIVFDNTFPKRLQRMLQAVRTRIVEELMKQS